MLGPFEIGVLSYMYLYCKGEILQCVLVINAVYNITVTHWNAQVVTPYKGSASSLVTHPSCFCIADKLSLIKVARLTQICVPMVGRQWDNWEVALGRTVYITQKLLGLCFNVKKFVFLSRIQCLIYLTSQPKIPTRAWSMSDLMIRQTCRH